MKTFTLAVIAVVICATVAFPQQKEGQAYSDEAIQQARITNIIPGDAQIQNVQESVQIAAYESIPIGENIQLGKFLGDQLPPEVISNLQIQIDQIGRN